MKNLKICILAVALAFTSLSVAAQGTETKEKTKAKGSMAEKSHLAGTNVRDGYMMVGGKMMVMRAGKPVMMEEDVDLPNGTTLLRDGTIRMSDGTTKTMQNGDRIALDGTMSHDHAGHSGMDHSQMKDQPAKGKMKMKEDKIKVKDRESDSKVKYDK